MVVLGCGMAVTVAPLTTVVMNSIAQDRVGAASGINNAVARVAGVLAIAVLGIAMGVAFGSRMDRSLAGLSLSSESLHSLQAEEIKIAGMMVPDTVDPNVRARFTAIAEAFVFGFRVIMLICSALAAASAVITRLTITTEKPQ
jgi:hypothetical protein